jgi:hypothetical protein
MTKMMKSHFYLFCAISSLILNFSCQRAVDSESTMISIELPGVAPQNQGLPIAKMIDDSTKISSLSAGESADQQSESFLEIVSTGYSADSNYPINCYLIAVSGPEIFLKKNFCGKTNTAQNLLERTYSFGTFIGLRPAGSTLELEATPGDNRQIVIFGLHSTSAEACTDFINKPSKTNFSKPHMLGMSAAMKFEGGKSIIVPVNLEMPTETNQMDDCVLNNDQQKQMPIANTITIDNRSFPFNNLRSKTGGNGITCEPFDIQLKYVDSNSNQQQGVMPNAIAVQISRTRSDNALTTQKTLFADANACVANDATAPTYIIIPAGDSVRRVWSRITLDDGTPSDYTATSNGLLSVATNFSVYDQTTTFMYDAILPRQISKNDCVPLSISIKQINGITPSSLPISGDFTIAAVDSSSNPIGQFYSDTGCTTSRSQSVLLTGTSAVVYYKTDQATSFVDIKINKQYSPLLALPFNQRLMIQTKPTGYNPVVSQMRLSIKSHFPKDINCVPLNIQFMDQAGFLIPATNSTLEFVPGESDINQLYLYDSHT